MIESYQTHLLRIAMFKSRKVWIYFENDVFIEAKSFGTESDCIVGEAVFNTSLSGYQEILSDPSYAGQFIVFCMPEIGIVGCNDNDMESTMAFAKGAFIRNINQSKSNFRATSNLIDFFEKQGLIGIFDVDTRGIVKMLRDSGALNLVASTSINDKEKLRKILLDSKKINEIDYIKEVSTKEGYIHDKSIFDFGTFDFSPAMKHAKKIVAIDFGVKKSILNELSNAGFIVEVISSSFCANDIVDRYRNGEIVGVFLSNGPGDPSFLTNQIEKIKILIEARIPMFAICLGHQLISNAFGYNTYKLKFGQHGANHPVKNLQTQQLEITSQNHNYNVPESIQEIAIVTHRNLFDNTIEGLRYKHYPILSIQHHPEASPGPKDSNYIFKAFSDMIEQEIANG